jgi:hypothetical protein
MPELTVKDFDIFHINTGCLYEKEGQKITIAYGRGSDNKVYFFDHTRMIDGMIDENSNLTLIGVIKAYINNDYYRIELEPYDLRYKFEKFYYTAEFKDYSKQYKTLIRQSWR